MAEWRHALPGGSDMQKLFESRAFATFLRVSAVLLWIEGSCRIIFADAPAYALLGRSDNIFIGAVGLALAVATWRKGREVQASADRR